MLGRRNSNFDGMWDNLRRRFEEMDEMFNSFFGKNTGFSSLSPLRDSAYPKFNSYYDSKTNSDVVEVAATGLSKDDVSVRVEDGCISVSANKVSKEENGDYYHRSLSMRSFSKKWKLSPDHDIDNIRAELSNGLLSIKIPKLATEEDSTSKDIKIE